jgi:hypothetical protein
MGEINAGGRLAYAAFEVLAGNDQRYIRGGISPGQRAEVRPKGLDLRQRVTDASVIAGIARRIHEADIDLSARQCGPVPPNHFGRVAGTEYPLECLSLVGFNAERVHALEEGLAVSEDIA